MVNENNLFHLNYQDFVIYQLQFYYYWHYFTIYNVIWS